MFVWLCHTELRSADSADWRWEWALTHFSKVHLLNLWTFLMMFRLVGSSKHLTLVLDDSLAAEICAAEMLSGLKPSFAFFLDLSADLQIHLMGRAWISMIEDRSFGASRRLKCAEMQKLSQIALAECLFIVTEGSKACVICAIVESSLINFVILF